jgi:hypothetical protein
LGITDTVIHWPRDTEPYRGSLDVLEAVAADLEAARSIPVAPTD